MGTASDSGPPTDSVRVGVLATGHPDRPLARDEIVALEATGCDSLWSAGHVMNGKPVPEALMGLARLAALSERVEVGTAVIPLPLYHPVVLAKQLAELDRASGGRVAVGVGVGGEYPAEFAACGVPLAERGARTDEAIEVMRRLWSSGRADFPGRWWSLDGASIDPPPVRPGGPPVIVAGRKRASMRRAARRGDGWMPFLVSPRAYAASVETIAAEAAVAGRDLEDFEWMCFVYVSVDPDPEVARRRALDFIGAGQAGDPARFEALLDRVAAVGTPDMVAGRLREYVQAGTRHFVVAGCDPADPVGHCQRLMTEVVPRLAGAATENADAGH